MSNLFLEVARCDLEPVTWLFFGPNVPALVYYTHLPNLTISLFLAIFVLFQSRRNLPNKILFYTVLAFVTWIFFALIFWASNRSDVIMFAWSMDILVEPLVHIGVLYLLYVLVERRDMPFTQKIILILLYAPVALFVPTSYSLSGFDTVNCLAVEGPIALYYTYFVEVVATAWLIVFSIGRYLNEKVLVKKKEVLYLSAGAILLFFAFSWGNITGSFTENWQLGQYGLFGMPVFIAFLVYSIVKFRTFQIKLLATQALVITLWVALAAVLFLQTIEYVRIIVSLTLILFLVVGVLLVRSVKREVEQRERIEKLAKDLAVANDKLKELDQLKSEFVSIASHQLRSPLSAIKGYASLILEGSFGRAPAAIGEAVQKIFDSSKALTIIIEDFLNISRIEQGRMKYEFAEGDVAKLAEKVIEELLPSVTRANLTISFETDKKPPYKANIDIGKIHQVFINIIDNATKYTPKGSISIRVSKKASGKILFSVSDTGVGMDSRTIPTLFEKFTRAKDANKTNVTGTGLGLYVAKQMVEAHGGRIWAESEGKGKGSTFNVELKAIS